MKAQSRKPPPVKKVALDGRETSGPSDRLLEPNVSNTVGTKAESITSSKVESAPVIDTSTERKSSDAEHAVHEGTKISAPRKKVLKKVIRVVRKAVGKTRSPVIKQGMMGGDDHGMIKEEVKGDLVKQDAAKSRPIESGRNDLLDAGVNKPSATKVAQFPAKTNQFVIDLEQPAMEDPEEGVRPAEIPAKEERPAEVAVSDADISSSSIHGSEPYERECGNKLGKNVDDGMNELKKQKTAFVQSEDSHKVDMVGDGSKNEATETNYDEYGDCVDFDDHEEDEYDEEDPEEDRDTETGEPSTEFGTLEEERRVLAAVAEDRKSKKEYEIFVGGLDREATEDDVKRAFKNIGDVVEVRLHKDILTNKNKGYAFVKFASKDHVKRALSEMKNPVIRGKRCGTAPSEDNDTLFLGNICNTWTKEAIRQKLKDYGVEGIESITLVPDAQHEGRSRGFAFIEFSCHADAILAYKRLQKPDVVFGHSERTAKVAFAEPIREPDPEVMAQVKTVFLDGLPPHWDEDQVKEHLKGQGEVVRVVLARNMSTAKRKDFGFVDFTTHEAAVACIEKLNDVEMGDGNTKVRARLSNPLPKTQAVKGGMSGGFRIGHTGSTSYPRYGRGFIRGGLHGSWPNFQRGRGYQRRIGHVSRGDPTEILYDERYPVFHDRQNVGRGGGKRGTYHQPSRSVSSADPSRFNYDRACHHLPDRLPGDRFFAERPPFVPDPGYRPYSERHFDEPYCYDDGSRGMKRPFFFLDHQADFGEPIRMRPRFDYSDPAASFHRVHFRDYGRGGGTYSRDYYGSDHGLHPPFYGGGRPSGRGYYY